MDSPAKKLDFSPQTVDVPIKAKPLVGLPELTKPVVAEERGAVSTNLKSEEADEPLLRENPNRFVLFPIKYHEVCA